MESIDPMEKFKSMELENSMTDMLQLLFDDDNIELKTEMSNPYAIASLETLSRVSEGLGLEKTGGTLEKHLFSINKNMVSHQRKGRGEFVDAFKSLNQTMTPELTIAEKLTTNLKDK